MYLNMSKISVCVPVHDMENREFFLNRLKVSLEKQTYKNWELVITNDGKMAENTNSAIQKATGDIIKILFMDDYFYDENALQHIADASGSWMVSGCVHDNGIIHNPHYPKYNANIWTGKNTIGSPSVLAFRNDDPLLFDERLSWLLDCDLYERLYQRYGDPTVINYLDIGIGIGEHQTSNIMSDEEKQEEAVYMNNKHTLWISA